MHGERPSEFLFYDVANMMLEHVYVCLENSVFGRPCYRAVTSLERHIPCDHLNVWLPELPEVVFDDCTSVTDFMDVLFNIKLVRSCSQESSDCSSVDSGLVEGLFVDQFVLSRALRSFASGLGVDRWTVGSVMFDEDEREKYSVLRGSLMLGLRVGSCEPPVDPVALLSVPSRCGSGEVRSGVGDGGLRSGKVSSITDLYS
jgi:hypothetical protein